MVDVCVFGPSKSFLQELLVRDLDPRTHQGGDDVVFDFSIRVRHAATSDDVEDAAPWRPAAACRTPGGAYRPGPRRRASASCRYFLSASSVSSTGLAPLEDARACRTEVHLWITLMPATNGLPRSRAAIAVLPRHVPQQRFELSRIAADLGSRWWTRPQERIVRLGSIAIPRQSLTQNALYDYEHMVFNPGTVCPSTGRSAASTAVYLASRQRKLNMVGHEQPAEARSFGRTSADAGAAECRE